MTLQEESLALLKKHRIEHPNRFEQLLYRAVSLINRGYWIGFAPLWDRSEYDLLFTNDPT